MKTKRQYLEIKVSGMQYFGEQLLKSLTKVALWEEVPLSYRWNIIFFFSFFSSSFYSCGSRNMKVS
jgi:hypothetical protein